MFFSKKPTIITDEAKVDEVLTRGVAEVLPTREGLKKELMSGRRLRLYQGFDPTGDKLHIGHMVGLRKLRAFQDLGHEVIFLIGDGTGQAGDPSGKTTAREKFFSTQELRDNARNYVGQAGSVVRFKGENAARILFNGDWLNKLNLTDILNIAGHFSLQQLSERDIFKRRMEKGDSVNLREFLYPLLQAYDSVAMDVDLEIGATDQTFNMLMGRTLIRQMKQKEKFVLTTPLLTDSSGKKIGKSEGNVIGITDEPHDLYGKIMALGDDVIVKGFEYLTDTPMVEVRALERAIATGENPKQFKKMLAFEVVKQLHNEHEAHRAQEHFESTFEMKKIPTEVPTINSYSGVPLSEVLVGGILSSTGAFTRLVDEGAIRNAETGEKITDKKTKIEKTTTVKVGKHRFIKIIVA